MGSGFLAAVLALNSQIALGAMVIPDDATRSQSAAPGAVSMFCAGTPGDAPHGPSRHLPHAPGGALCPLSIELAATVFVLGSTPVLPQLPRVIADSTPNTALILNDGDNILDTEGSETEAGWGNFFITGKWQAYINATHEFVVFLGVIPEIGGSGIPVLRPFAVTGELSFTIADKELKQTEMPGISPASANAAGTGIATEFNNGNNNAWSGGLSLQYSLPYLQSELRNIGLPAFSAT